MADTAAAWIEKLDLKPLPVEGGYFREVARSDEVTAADALPVRYATPRSLYTAIHYLVTADTCSALHMLQTDEVWAFLAGNPASMLQLFETGTGREVRLHNSGAPDTESLVVVPRRVWQGVRLEAGGRFALFATFCAPGYDPLDFQAGRRDALAETYPDFADTIRALTPE